MSALASFLSALLILGTVVSSDGATAQVSQCSVWPASGNCQYNIAAILANPNMASIVYQGTVTFAGAAYTCQTETTQVACQAKAGLCTWNAAFSQCMLDEESYVLQSYLACQGSAMNKLFRCRNITSQADCDAQAVPLGCMWASGTCATQLAAQIAPASPAFNPSIASSVQAVDSEYWGSCMGALIMRQQTMAAAQPGYRLQSSGTVAAGALGGNSSVYGRQAGECLQFSVANCGDKKIVMDASAPQIAMNSYTCLNTATPPAGCPLNIPSVHSGHNGVVTSSVSVLMLVVCALMAAMLV